MRELLYKLLPWDSEFFGLRIGQAYFRPISQGNVHELFQWANKNSVECIYHLVDFGDAGSISICERNGFRLTDMRLTFGLEMPQDDVAQVPSDTVAAPIQLRLASSEDIPLLKKIARSSYRHTRFYVDDGFSNELCDRLYETWIDKSCNGYADAVWVAAIDSKPVGYLTCDVDRETLHGQIGLVGIDSAVQGRGIGKALLAKSLEWFEQSGVSSVTVVTQARNIPAQRLYQGGGFRTVRVDAWYHKWFSKSS